MRYQISKIPRIKQKLDSLKQSSNGCIEWIYATNGDYGVVRLEKSNKYVHRLILCEYYNLDYQADWQAMHLCDNKRCVNINHLMVGNASLNIIDTVLKGIHHEVNRIQCPKGHLYDKNNTFYRKGKRACKTCIRIYDRRRNIGRVVINGKRVRVHAPQEKSI